MKKWQPALVNICLLAGGLGSTAAFAQASTPFLGEMRWVAFNFAPTGWSLCDGQLLAINQNQALFALLGTTFGGDGRTTFALPDMRGRAPIHVAAAHALGSTGGEESHTLTTAEMPAHNHNVLADAKEANAAVATQNYPAKTSGGTSGYAVTPGLKPMGPAIVATGGDQPHQNMKPYLTLNCIIALQGIFPARP